MIAWLVAIQLWVTIPDNTSILQGNWQSCQLTEAEGGGHGERVYDYHKNGELKWSFHMGPLDDFSLFAAGTELDPDFHDTPLNLLAQQPSLKKRRWSIRSLKLRIEVTQAGGSRDDCQSYFVRIEPLKAK